MGKSDEEILGINTPTELDFIDMVRDIGIRIEESISQEETRVTDYKLDVLSCEGLTVHKNGNACVAVFHEVLLRKAIPLGTGVSLSWVQNDSQGQVRPGTHKYEFTVV